MSRMKCLFSTCDRPRAKNYSVCERHIPKSSPGQAIRELKGIIGELEGMANKLDKMRRSLMRKK